MPMRKVGSILVLDHKKIRKRKIFRFLRRNFQVLMKNEFLQFLYTLLKQKISKNSISQNF